MNKVRAIYIGSAKQLKKIRTITICAFLGAVGIVLGMHTVMVGSFLKIGFSSLANETASYLFGPVVGAVFGGTMDVVKYIMKPTGPFFPGFTLTAILAGLINGTLLYKKRITLARVCITKLTVIVFCDMILNTAWLSIMLHDPFYTLFLARVWKNVIMWPIQSVLMYAVLNGVMRAGIARYVMQDETVTHSADEKKEPEL